MPKLIVLYNLAPNVTEEQFDEYITKEKGPVSNTLPSVKKYELVKTIESPVGKSPYKYIEIYHLESMEEWTAKGFSSARNQEIFNKWKPMATDMQFWFAEENY